MRAFMKEDTNPPSGVINYLHYRQLWTKLCGRMCQIGQFCQHVIGEQTGGYKIGDRRPVVTLVPFRLIPAWFSGFVSNNNNSRPFSSDPGLVFRVPDLLLKLISHGSRRLNHYPPVRKTLCRVTTILIRQPDRPYINRPTPTTGTPECRDPKT